MAIGDFMKSPAWLANAGHILAGMCVALVLTLFTHSRDVIGFVEAIFVLYVGLKEYWIDLTYESDETIGSSTIDALGYLGGNAVAWGLVAWSHAIGSW